MPRTFPLTYNGIYIASSKNVAHPAVRAGGDQAEIVEVWTPGSNVDMELSIENNDAPRCS